MIVAATLQQDNAKPPISAYMHELLARRFEERRKAGHNPDEGLYFYWLSGKPKPKYLVPLIVEGVSDADLDEPDEMPFAEDQSILPFAKPSSAEDPEERNLQIAEAILATFRGRADQVAMAFIDRDGKPALKPSPMNCTLTPVNRLLQHLTGVNCHGFYLFADQQGHVWLSCVDLDDHPDNPDPEWRTKAERLFLWLQQAGIHALVEISQSGTGAHVWIFFDEPVEGWVPRAFFRNVAKKLGIVFNEINPKQDFPTGKGFGNPIRYPLWNQSRFIDVENGWATIDPLEALNGIKRTSGPELKEIAAKLGFEMKVETRYDKPSQAPARELQISHELPARVEELLKDKTSLLAKRWNGYTAGLKDTSKSGLVAAIMTQLLLNYVPHADILAASRYWCRQEGAEQKGNRDDWLNTTLRNAQEYVFDEQQKRQSVRQENEKESLMSTCLKEVSAEPVRWLVEDYLPLGKLAIIAGDGGEGKTTLTHHITACLTTGRPCFELKYEAPDPCDVLLISCEDDFGDTVVPRLLAAGANLERVHKVDGVRNKDGKIESFNLGHVREMEQKLIANPNIKLVIVDPAGAYLGGKDDYKESELRGLLAPLAELAAKLEVSILLIKHLIKGETRKAVNKVGGSGAYINTVRAAFVVVRDKDMPGSKLFLPLKHNLAPDLSGLAFHIEDLSDEDKDAVVSRHGQHLKERDRQELRKQLFHLVWDGPVEVTADEVIAELDHAYRASSKVAQAGEWLKDFLGNYAFPSDEVFAAGKLEGFTKSNLYAAKKKLGDTIQASNRGFQGTWWWGLGSQEKWVIRPKD